MGRDVVDAMRRDPSISRDVNVLFQDVVRKVKRVKDIDESTAVDEVLLAVNDFAADAALHACSLAHIVVVDDFDHSSVVDVVLASNVHGMFPKGACAWSAAALASER